MERSPQGLLLMGWGESPAISSNRAFCSFSKMCSQWGSGCGGRGQSVSTSVVTSWPHAASTECWEPAFILLGVGCQLSSFRGKIPRMGNAGFVARGIGSSAWLPDSCLAFPVDEPRSCCCTESSEPVLRWLSSPVSLRATYRFLLASQRTCPVPPLQGVQIHE